MNCRVSMVSSGDSLANIEFFKTKLSLMWTLINEKIQCKVRYNKFIT